MNSRVSSSLLAVAWNAATTSSSRWSAAQVVEVRLGERTADQPPRDDRVAA
jgi:hypothetical protein